MCQGSSRSHQREQHREEFLNRTLRLQPGMLWGSPGEPRGALAGAGAHTGALCILGLVAPGSGKGAVPCALPCGMSAKFTASLEQPWTK